LWITDTCVPGAASAWSALAERFPVTGLWPLRLHSLYDGSGRPWESGELEPVALADIDAIDVREVLLQGWRDSLAPIRNLWPPGTGPLAPFGPEFPGLAPPQPESRESPAAFTAGAARLGLVSCRRPADAVAHAGWLGAINVTGAAQVSAVFRSWEDRFGAVLVGLSFATITLLVTRPPITDADALRVAAEIAAFCPDALWQPESPSPSPPREATLESMSRRLVREPVWCLWFDDRPPSAADQGVGSGRPQKFPGIDRGRLVQRQHRPFHGGDHPTAFPRPADRMGPADSSAPRSRGAGGEDARLGPVVDDLLVARNPDPDSSLPFLIRVPLGPAGIVVKARETWPGATKVHCHRAESWPADADILERHPVRTCTRRGPAIDLVLARARQNRSQLVFTRAREREVIFWQTPSTTKQARPRVALPTARAAGQVLEIVVDSGEKYPRSSGHQQAITVRRRLPAGDYAVVRDGAVLAAVERESLADLAGSLRSGKLTYALAELAALPRAAVVVEDRYSRLFALEHWPGAAAAEALAEAQARFPSVPIVFCETRTLAQEWAYRWLGACLTELDAAAATSEVESTFAAAGRPPPAAPGRLTSGGGRAPRACTSATADASRTTSSCSAARRWTAADRHRSWLTATRVPPADPGDRAHPRGRFRADIVRSPSSRPPDLPTFPR
jgi:hypothetical protein